MQAIPSVMHCWCHFGVSTIISESGRNLAYGEGSLGFTLELQHTDYATVLQHPRNCTICTTHKLVMSLKGYLGWSRSVMSECTALLSWKSGFGGVSDSGFSLCTVSTYYFRSEYFYNQHPQVWNLIRTECSLNRDEHRVIINLEYSQ